MEHLTTALTARAARRTAWQHALPVPIGHDPLLRPGDLRTVTGPNDLTRQALLMRSVSKHGVALWQVRLVHSYPEFATDSDLVVPGWQIAPYPVVVHSAWPFCVLASQIVPARNGYAFPATLTDATPGTKVGPLDARCAFVQTEFEDVQALQAEALPHLLEVCDCADWPEPQSCAGCNETEPQRC